VYEVVSLNEGGRTAKVNALNKLSRRVETSIVSTRRVTKSRYAICDCPLFLVFFVVSHNFVILLLLFQ
jgi:hypothetical protein